VTPYCRNNHFKNKKKPAQGGPNRKKQNTPAILFLKKNIFNKKMAARKQGPVFWHSATAQSL
jgi:hypothetical protein